MSGNKGGRAQAPGVLHLRINRTATIDGVGNCLWTASLLSVHGAVFLQLPLARVAITNLMCNVRRSSMAGIVNVPHDSSGGHLTSVDSRRPRSIPPTSSYGSQVMITSHGAPMPFGAKTAEEVLSAQTPTICSLPAHFAIRGLAVIVIAWNGFSLAMLETTELGQVMSYLSIFVYAWGLVASFTSFSAPKVAQGFYILVAAELVAVLCVDIYKISNVRSQTAEAEARSGSVGGGAPGAGTGADGGSGSERQGEAPNLTVSVFSLLVNAILHLGCLICARSVFRVSWERSHGSSIFCLNVRAYTLGTLILCSTDASTGS